MFKAETALSSLIRSAIAKLANFQRWQEIGSPQSSMLSHTHPYEPRVTNISTKSMPIANKMTLAPTHTHTHTISWHEILTNKCTRLDILSLRSPTRPRITTSPTTAAFLNDAKEMGLVEQVRIVAKTSQRNIESPTRSMIPHNRSAKLSRSCCWRSLEIPQSPSSPERYT